MKELFRSWLPYFFLGSFILGWWAWAFHASPATLSFAAISPQTLTLKNETLLEALSPLQRDSLQHVLAGNFTLIPKLIDDWDRDARLLIERGVAGVQRLSAEKTTQAHILGQLIADSSPELLRQLNCKMNVEWLQDDCGECFHIEDTFQQFLPQTYISASFLLSIAHPTEIIALPKGLRRFTQLYPKELLAQIPTDIDQINSETLYLKGPDLAFIAPYSHPPTLEVLRNQHIPLYSIKNINTIDEIQEALLKVGHATNHILEAQLLTIFMEASLLAIDNRLEALHEKSNSLHTPLRLLYLTYHQHYALPTTKSLAGQLMTRALSHSNYLICSIPESQDHWQFPFEQEQIVQAAPDVVIVATFDVRARAQIHNTFQHMDPFQGKQLFCIDETIQNSPTQHIVLGYFDLFQTLINI